MTSQTDAYAAAHPTYMSRLQESSQTKFGYCPPFEKSSRQVPLFFSRGKALPSSSKRGTVVYCPIDKSFLAIPRAITPGAPVMATTV